MSCCEVHAMEGRKLLPGFKRTTDPLAVHETNKPGGIDVSLAQSFIVVEVYGGRFNMALIGTLAPNSLLICR